MIGARRLEVRGWHVLVALLGFFGAIIAVNVAFAVIAVQSFPGEDARRSYLQGLRFNDALAERRAQAMLGWRAGAMLREGEDGAVLEVALRDAADAPLSGVALEGELQRPTDSHFDHALTFEEAGAGRYVARIGAIERGRWRLRARAENAQDGALDFEAEFAWPPQR